MNKGRLDKVGAERKAVLDVIIKAIGPATLYEAARHYNTTRATMTRVLEGKEQNPGKGRPPRAYTAQELGEILESEVKHRTADEYIELLAKLGPKIKAALR
jgi:hypothetical protein